MTVGIEEGNAAIIKIVAHTHLLTLYKALPHSRSHGVGADILYDEHRLLVRFCERNLKKVVAAVNRTDSHKTCIECVDLLIIDIKHSCRTASMLYVIGKQTALLAIIDHLLSTAEDNRAKVLEAYPQFREKTVVLYAPTFRRNIELHWEELADRLTEEGNIALIVKGHPNQQLSTDNPAVYTCPEFKAVDLLSVCDYLVTDYSAIAIEGAVLKRPTYYFVYDYEEYREKNGMNIDLFETMPGCVFRNAEDLAEAIVKGEYNYKALEDYREKYLPENLGTSTEQIVKLITEKMKK